MSDYLPAFRRQVTIPLIRAITKAIWRKFREKPLLNFHSRAKCSITCKSNIVYPQYKAKSPKQILSISSVLEEILLQHKTRMTEYISLPPEHEELHIQLPSIIHTQTEFLRPLIQFDYDMFLQFTHSQLFKRHFREPLDVSKTFIEVVNSYKSTNPFLMLAIVDRISFSGIGFIIIVPQHQELVVLIYCESPDEELADHILKYCQSFGFDQINIVSSEQNDHGFEDGSPNDLSV